MKKLVAAFAASLLAVALAQGTSAPAASAAPSAPSYTPPPISWGPCTNPTLVAYGSQCGTLVVPRDYAHPHGPTIGLAVSRLKHKTPDSQYQGVMLVNPGGPGGSGLIYSVLQGAPPNGSGEAYDWIGFDPRGVGSSSPEMTCDPTVSAGPRPPYRPTTKKIHDAWVGISKGYAQDCKDSKDSALFNHVKTTDSVADMESLRKALGEKQINYYGFSYGTYLGQVYATLHPDRVRRFVWDGTVNPQRVFYKSNQDQDVAFQKTFEIYFRWLAKYHDVYHVGDTFNQVRKTYLATVAKLDKHPVGILGGDELTDVFTSAGYYVYGWEDIAQAYSDYINNGDPTGLIQQYPSPTTPDADNGYAMYLGTQCTDAPWPRDQRKLDRDNWKLDKKYYYMTWSNAWFNGPCAYWKYKASRPVNVKGSKVKVPILMIGETYDAATPFSGSLVTRRLFPTASLIEGVNGSTHAGSLSGVACTDDAIAAYLTDGTVPKRKSGNRSDLKCPPVPQPDPTATTGLRSLKASSGLPQVLRDGLEQAQLHR
jgi:pimeloyl-ACP methyl ester carboxylesterase